MGPIGEPLVSVALVLFAVTTIAYNAFLGENSIAYFERLPKASVNIFRCMVLALIAWASMQDLGTVFSFSDLTMALLALTNLAAMWKLYPIGIRLLKDFEAQRRTGQTPVFMRSQMPEEDLDPASWGAPADLEQTA